MQNLDLRRGDQFKVRPECGDAGVGIVSETSERIKTMATSPPGKPTAAEVTYNSIQLQWSKSVEQCANIEGYEVWYKEVQQEAQWRKIISSGPIVTAKITRDIDFGSEYVFKVVPLCNIGKGSESEISDPVRTKTTSPPGKPIPSSATYNNVQLEWTKPEFGRESIVHYSVFACSGEEFKNVETKKIPSSRDSEEKVKISIGELASNTEYVFKVQPHCLSGPGDESKPSKLIKTKCIYYKPGKPSAKTTTFDKVHLKWTRPDYGGHKVECYSVFYRVVSDSKWMKTATEKITTDQKYMYMFTLDSLLPGMKYIFKVQSHITGSNGKLMEAEESDLSDPIQTKATTPPGKPIAISRSFKSIHLEWTAPEHGEENIDYYVIKYWEKHGQLVTTNSVRKSHVVQGLRSKTQYTFTVIPQCKVGEGEESESSIIDTPQSCRPGKAKCVASTHNSITLTWKKPDYCAKDVEYYNLSYRSKHSKDKHEMSLKIHEVVTINFLAPNTEYTFEVLPVCKVNAALSCTECSISNPIATMATSPPGKPTKFNSTHDSVTLQWTKPAIGSEEIKHYMVMYQEKSTLSSMFSSARNFKEVTTDKVQEKVTVTNLFYNTKYVFKVQAMCAGDTEDKFASGMESELSDPIATNTTSPPGKPKASKTTHNSITLVWGTPRYGSSHIETYIIYLSTDGNKWTSKSELSEQRKHRSSVSCTVLNLNPKTTYFFRVSLVCVNDAGSDSEVSSPIVTKATAPPGTPRALKVTHDCIHVDWESPNYGIEKIDHYLLLYTEIEKLRETTWTSLTVDCGKTEYCVDKLTMKSHYIYLQSYPNLQTGSR